MRMRRALAAAAGGVTLLAGCSQAATPAARQPATPRPAGVPLATSVLGPDGVSYAIVEMGGKAAANENFWQLFARPEHGSGWRLVTPPGVADNGGLVQSSSARSLLVGFETSQELGFSPLAESSDTGRSWNPAVLPSPLGAVPDALAAAGGGALALVRSKGGSVLAAGSSLSSWRTVATTASIAGSAGACGVARLTAVALDGGGRQLVAAACTRPGVVGVLVRHGRGFTLAGPPLPAGERRQVASVVRLERAGSGLAALVALSGPSGTAVLSATEPAPGAPWSLSPPLGLDGAGLSASGLLPGGGAFVLERGAGTPEAAVIGAPRGGRWPPWSRLPTLPAGTQTIACSPAGSGWRIDAIAVEHSTMTDHVLEGAAWGPGGLAASGAHWVDRQRIVVPIQYGSSG